MTEGVIPGEEQERGSAKEGPCFAHDKEGGPTWNLFGRVSEVLKPRPGVSKGTEASH